MQFINKIILIFFMTLVFVTVVTSQNKDVIPEKSEWRATASGIEKSELSPEKAIDNDLNTRWGSPFYDPQWLQIDMGKSVTVTGFRIVWEVAYSSVFAISVSKNKAQWTQVYYTKNGDGKIDEIFITPTQARYIKLDCFERATGWGHSVMEFDVKGASEQVSISENGNVLPQTTALMDGDENSIWKSKKLGNTSIQIDLRSVKDISGIHILWGENYAQNVALRTSVNGKDWKLAAQIDDGVGNFEALQHEIQSVQFLKIDLSIPKNKKVAFLIKEIKLYTDGEEITPRRKYELRALKSPEGYYPLQLRKEQVYWTLLGVPADTQETLFDEFGNVEPYKGASMLMPFVSHKGRLLSALDATSLEHTLLSGYLPIPSVRWNFDAFTFDIQGFSDGNQGESVSHVRYRLSNTSDTTIQADVFFVMQPFQINPQWQHGGLSPIRKLEIVSQGKKSEVVINEKTTYVLPHTPDKFFATSFEEGDIINSIVNNNLLESNTTDADSDLNSGAFMYTFTLSPGEYKDVFVSIPLHDNSLVDVTRSFTERLQIVRNYWKEKLDVITFDMPAKDVVNTLKSQIAYILLNQDGTVIQPGSRNYNRTWIRDGSVASVAMMRMGLFEEAKKYFQWYAERVEDDGLVPPILNNDGTIYQGWGSNIEWDSQGQFIFGMMEYYRYTQDTDFLKEYFPSIHRAMKYMVTLRERTLYTDVSKENIRFQGILPPSISHEGYSDPVYSYWDDYWALRGWIDGIQAAEILGEYDISTWAKKELQDFKESLQTSLLKTIEHFGIDYIPSSADRGDFDATGTAIALFLGIEKDIIPMEILKNTFMQYVNSVDTRMSSGNNYSYTPYEVRNIFPLARLGFKEEAFKIHEVLFNDRRPANWNFFAEVVHSRARLGSYIGDMPHTWVGAGYLNSVRNMIVVENDVLQRLQILVGTPKDWLLDSGIVLDKFPTHFGRLTMNAHLNADNTALSVVLGGSLHNLKDIEIFFPIHRIPSSIVVDGKTIDSDTLDSVVVDAKTREVLIYWK